MHIFKPFLLLALAMSILAGCADEMVTGRLDSPPVGPNFKPAAQSLKLRHMTLVPVRTFDADDEKLEGVTCRLENQYYELTVVTPGVVNLPSYGPQTPDVQVTCQTSELRARQTIQPFNRTRMNTNAAVAGAAAGVMGSIVVTSTNRTREGAPNDVFTYDPIYVRFKQ